MSTTNTSPSTSTTGGGCPFHRGEDDTLSLLRLGYRFLPTLREERTGADDDRPFRFGLLGRRAHALRGSRAVPTFYDPELIERHGAMPTPIQGSLFGKGSVHSLDGEPHLARKELFVAVCYEQEQVDRIKPLVEAEVREAVARWAKYPETVYDAMVIAYGRASLRWAGIEGPDSELDVQAKRLGDIVDRLAGGQGRRGRGRCSRPLAVDGGRGLRPRSSWRAQVLPEGRKLSLRPGPSR